MTRRSLFKSLLAAPLVKGVPASLPTPPPSLPAVSALGIYVEPHNVIYNWGGVLTTSSGNYVPSVVYANTIYPYPYTTVDPAYSTPIQGASHV